MDNPDVVHIVPITISNQSERLVSIETFEQPLQITYTLAPEEDYEYPHLNNGTSNGLRILTQQGRFELVFYIKNLSMRLPVARKNSYGHWRSVVESTQPLCMVGVDKVRAVVNADGGLQLTGLDKQKIVIANSVLSWPLAPLP